MNNQDEQDTQKLASIGPILPPNTPPNSLPMTGPTLGPSTTPRVPPFIPERAGTGARSRRRIRIAALISGVLLVAVLLGSGLYGIFTFINQSRATNSKASLDRVLVAATANGKVPAPLLQPIQAKEQQIAASTDSTPWGWDHANSQYVQLQSQVTSIVNMPSQQARSLTQNDLTKFSAAVASLTKDNYQEAPGYQDRLQKAQNALVAARTTRDIFIVDNTALDQVAALAAFRPTLGRLQALEALVKSEQQLLGTTGPASQQNLMCAIGLSYQYWDDTYGTKITTQKQPLAPPIESQWIVDDWAFFRTASTAADYVTLNRRMDSQTAQVQANQSTLLPSYTAHVLEAFQADIQLIQKNGGSSKDVSKYQQLYQQDVSMLSGTPSPATYLSVVKQVQKQHNDIQLPLARATANHDVKVLQDLIKQGNSTYTIDPSNGQKYPNAYEYSEHATGIGDATDRLNVAKTTEDYQLVDMELQMFIHNIQAMLDNLKDPKTSLKDPKAKGRYQTHDTDLRLMQYYGVTPSQVMVVSLREQVARFYENGQLVRAVDVATGSPDLPSIPGIHCELSRESPTIFKSPWPKGSPHYYKDTPINYGMRYSFYGYYVHDAWWRNTFGLFTNLPHYDPAAFNGGTHGCINVSLHDMAWVYSWLPYGAPIIVY
ncbi:MAG TPA: L,D-transpeptidase [Ktedonobacterales bacterium]|nr:L,D-transpeptidase [Ktedonobacterales bacterium]